MASSLQKALKKEVGTGELSNSLDELEDYEIESMEDAEAVCDKLQQALDKLQSSKSPDPLEDDLHALAGLFQNVASSEAQQVFAQNGMPVLMKLFEHLGPDADANLRLFILKIFAAYGYPPSADIIVRMARDPEMEDEYLWTVIFEAMSPEGHPFQEKVALELSSPLPGGFARVAYLDFVNELSKAGVLEKHPFDTAEGKEMIREWLEAEEPSSYAVSASMALAFMEDPERDELAQLAWNNEGDDVKMEIAWADAYQEKETGLNFLREKCLDPVQALKAAEYLEMLDREDLIPEQANDPEFQAKAEMIQWLCHPNEYGDPPDEIELIDTREMYWPPTEDMRTLWAFKYTYVRDEEEEEEEEEEDLPGAKIKLPAPEDEEVGDEEGETTETQYGLVGSVTFSLFDSYGEVKSPDDVYALHCAWEAEGKADLKKGRKLLAKVKGR